MAFYLGLFAGITAFGYIICNKTKLKYRNEIFVIAAFLLLCVLSCIRYDVGFDYSYGGYTGTWNRILETPFSDFMKIDEEFGFTLFAYFLSLFGENYQILYIGTSILLAVLAGLFVYIHCKDKVWGFFLVYGLGMYYCSMNLIRQTIAMFIFAFAVPMIKKKKIVPYMLLVLLAATFHKSALLMIPFYFILQIRITKVVFAFYAVVTAGLFLTSDLILDVVTKIWYGGYVDSIYLIYGNDWFYLITPVILLSTMYIFRNKILSADKKNYIYINCAFFNFFFWFIAWKHTLVDRFTVYFEPAIIIAVCILMKKLKEDKEKGENAEIRAVCRKRYALAVSLVAACGIISNVMYLIEDGHGILPYDTIFTNEDYRIYSDSLKMPENIIEAPEIL